MMGKEIVNLIRQRFVRDAALSGSLLTDIKDEEKM